MTAEPTGQVMWSPDPIRQRLAAHTLEDVHQDITALLWHWLRQRAPERFRASQATGVAVSLTTSVEPDVLKAPFEIRLPIRDITP